MSTRTKSKTDRNARKKRRRARRHARRRRRRPRADSETDLILQSILRQLQGQHIHAKPPADPYARGSTVPPMKTAQKKSEEEYRRAAGAQHVHRTWVGGAWVNANH